MFDAGGNSILTGESPSGKAGLPAPAPLKAKLRHYLERRWPGSLAAIRSIRNRAIFRRRFQALQDQVRQGVFADRNPVVLTGPFAGMSYLDETIWGSITPKWLGSYECELHDIIETIITRGYRTVIDVGCAEGYYAVGLARRMQASTVLAYDTDFLSRRQTRRLARLNGIGTRLTVHGFCSQAEIERRGPGALIICDIEGWERQLLEPERCPVLRHCDILVELHQRAGEGDITELFQARFGRTHRIQSRRSRPRDEWAAQTAPQHRAWETLLKSGVLPAAMDEHRHEQQTWLWLEAMARGKSPGFAGGKK